MLVLLGEVGYRFFVELDVLFDRDLALVVDLIPDLDFVPQQGVLLLTELEPGSDFSELLFELEVLGELIGEVGVGGLVLVDL